MDGLWGWLERSNFDFVTALKTVMLLAAAFLFILWFNRLLRRLISRGETRRYLPYDRLLTATRMVTGSLWLITAMLVLSLWGVSVGGLWALIVSVAAVIGVGFLAVWTMASNMTASLFITIWQPFHLGQTVEILPENLKGRVIDRNLMFTVLREEGGSVVQVPNNLFFQKVFKVTGDAERSFFELIEEREQSRRREPSAVG